MKFCSFVFLVTFLFTLNVKSQIKSSDSDNQKITTNSRRAYVEGEVILKFKSSGTSLQCGKSTDKLKVNDKDINMLSDKFGVYELKELHKKSSQPVKSYAKKDETGTSKAVLLRFDKQFNPENVAKEFEELENVEYAEPNYIYSFFKYIPNDEYLNNQWHLGKIGAYEAWEIEQGDSSITIGIIDSGVEWNHPDLEKNIWVNPGEDINHNGIIDEADINDIDDDGNGYIDDVRGWDFVDNATDALEEEDGMTPDNDPSDFFGHGTVVAGVISATMNNSTGIAGVAPKCRIVPLRAGYCNGYRSGNLTEEAIAEALYYAADNNIDIVNMSIGSDPNSELLNEAIEYAYDAGVILIAAAGNEDADNYHYPASNGKVIAVTSTTYNDKKAAHANFGSWVDIVAPGINIFSTSMQNDYTYRLGTSLSCPIVSGVTALIKSLHPDWSNEQILACLFVSSKNIDNLNPKFKGKIGVGRVDALKALETIPLNHHITIYDLSENDYHNAGNESLFDSIAIIPKIKNYGLEGQNIYIKIMTDNQYVTIKSDSIYFGNLLFRDTAVANKPCIFKINPETPLGEMANIAFQVYSANAPVYELNHEFILHKAYKYREGFPIKIDGNVTSINTGDLDNDNKKEIVCYVEDYGFRVYSERGKYKYSITKSDEYYDIYEFFIADINNDNCDDIIFNALSSGTSWLDEIPVIYVKDKEGQDIQGWPVENPFEYEGVYIVDNTEIVISDLDGDDEVEIIAKDYLKNSGLIYNSDGTPYAPWMQNADLMELPMFHLNIADLDNDNDIDILGVDNNEIKIFYLDGSSYTDDPVIIDDVPDVTDKDDFNYLFIDDINSDDEQEIIAGAKDTNVYIWHQDGKLLYRWPCIPNIQNIVPKQLDNDPDLELIVINYHFIAAYECNGDLIWKKESNSSYVSVPYVIDFFDDSEENLIFASCEGDIEANHTNSSFSDVSLLDDNGLNVKGWPFQIDGELEIRKSLLIDDLDKNGSPEIIVLTSKPEAVGGYFRSKSYVHVMNNSSDWLSHITSVDNGYKKYDKNISDKFYIYPNPASDIITVKSDELHQIKRIELIDINGSVVLTKIPDNNAEKITIPINDIINGTYVVRILTENDMISKMITVL